MSKYIVVPLSSDVTLDAEIFSKIYSGFSLLELFVIVGPGFMTNGYACFGAALSDGLQLLHVHGRAHIEQFILVPLS